MKTLRLVLILLALSASPALAISDSDPTIWPHWKLPSFSFKWKLPDSDPPLRMWGGTRGKLKQVTPDRAGAVRAKVRP